MILQADTAELAAQRASDTAAYVSLLERTNEQLGWWISGASLFVAALGVLFAVGAIFAAVMLYRQGREHRAQIHGFIESYRVVLDGLIAESNARIDSTIETLRGELEAAGDEQKKRYEKEIEELQALKIRPAPTEMIERARPIRVGRHFVCENCGMDASFFADYGSKITVECPRCGHRQSV